MGEKVNKVLNMLGFGSEYEDEMEYDDDRELDYESAAYDRIKDRRSSKVVKFHEPSSQMRVVVIQPNTFDEAKDITQHLKGRKPVVVNLESIDAALAHRIFDFLCGAVYALDGSIQKISNRIFIIAPDNIDIMGEETRNEARGSFMWE